MKRGNGNWQQGAGRELVSRVGIPGRGNKVREGGGWLAAGKREAVVWSQRALEALLWNPYRRSVGSYRWILSKEVRGVTLSFRKIKSDQKGIIS